MSVAAAFDEGGLVVVVDADRLPKIGERADARVCKILGWHRIAIVGEAVGLAARRHVVAIPRRAGCCRVVARAGTARSMFVVLETSILEGLVVARKTSSMFGQVSMLLEVVVLARMAVVLWLSEKLDAIVRQ